MPKYRCNTCNTIKQMSKKPIDMFCDFCNFGEYELVRGLEGMGVKRRILGVTKEDRNKEDELEISEDWI